MVCHRQREVVTISLLCYAVMICAGCAVQRRAPKDAAHDHPEASEPASASHAAGDRQDASPQVERGVWDDPPVQADDRSGEPESIVAPVVAPVVEPVWRPGPAMQAPVAARPAPAASAAGRTWVVNAARANASDDGEGTMAAPFTTIGAAAERAMPGDRVVIHGGIYREHVRPARGGTAEKPITYEVASGERAVISGSDVWAPAWERSSRGDDIWSAELLPALFAEENPFHRTISIDGEDKSTHSRAVAAERGEPGPVALEIWTGIPGSDVALLTGATHYRDAPDDARFLDNFEFADLGDSYGSRATALLCPPVDGEYTFWLACDDGGELWLGTNESERSATCISTVDGYTTKHQWTKMPSQQAKPVKLAAGRRYFIRALQKEGGGGDHMAVAWKVPGSEREVIAAAHLAREPKASDTAALAEKAAKKSHESEKRDSMPETLGEVFLDGVRLPQVMAQTRLAETERAWMVNETGTRIEMKLPTGDSPIEHTVEITTRAQAFAPARRGLGYITVRGITFEKCANQGPFPQRGMLSVRSGHHWVIEDCVIRLAKTVGLDCGSEHWNGKIIANTDVDQQRVIIGGHHVIRRNRISDNGLCGIAGWNHKGTLIVDNIVERNNCLGFPHTEGWEEWAGIKLHGTDSVIRGNLVRDNQGHGIWIDNGHANAVIDGNVVLRNRQSGVMLELNHSPGNPVRIVNNVIVGSYGDGFYCGFGIYAHDASDIIVSDNLISGCSSYGVLMRTITNRVSNGKVVETSRVSITGNTLLNNGGRISFPFVSTRSTECDVQGNTYGEAEGDAALFELNTYAEGIDKGERAATLSRRLKDAGLDLGALAKVEEWCKKSVLSMKQWQHLRGYDTDSTVVSASASIEDTPEGKVLLTLTRPASSGGKQSVDRLELMSGFARER